MLLTACRMLKDVGPNLRGEIAHFPPPHAEPTP